jgi:hypothetical protein
VRRGGLIAAVVAGLLLSACGGSDTQLDLSAFKACYETEGTLVIDDEGTDFLADGAGVGATQLSDDTQEIQVVAERTSDDAEDTVGQYEGFGLGQVEQIGTVVLAANNTMTEEELDPIKSCLGEQEIK